MRLRLQRLRIYLRVIDGDTSVACKIQMFRSWFLQFVYKPLNNLKKARTFPRQKIKARNLHSYLKLLELEFALTPSVWILKSCSKLLPYWLVFEFSIPLDPHIGIWEIPWKVPAHASPQFRLPIQKGNISWIRHLYPSSPIIVEDLSTIWITWSNTYLTCPIPHYSTQQCLADGNRRTYEPPVSSSCQSGHCWHQLIPWRGYSESPFLAKTVPFV